MVFAAADTVFACPSAEVAAADAIWTRDASSALTDTSRAETTLIAEAAWALIAEASVDVTLPLPPTTAEIRFESALMTL
jgi:hypothetical protein